MLGRFVSRDPVAYTGGIHLLGYVSNRPTLHVDPLAMCQLYLMPLINYPPTLVDDFIDLTQEAENSPQAEGEATHAVGR